MARADFVTLLPLDRFAEIFSLDPLHFNQVTSNLRQVQAGINFCDDLWMQHGWQDVGKISREDIALAILEAEEKISRYIGYYPAPKWTIEEEQQWPRLFRRELTGTSGLNIRGLRKSVQLDWKHFISGGVRGLTLQEAGAAVVYSDTTGDLYKDTATITVTVDAGVTACEVAIFYPSHNGETAWEIRPITVSITGTTATITVKRERLPLEALLESLSAVEIDGDVDTNFLTTVDVYRVYNDPSTQLFFTEEKASVVGVATQTGFMEIRNRKQSIVNMTPGTWDATTDTFTINNFNDYREPDHLQASYLSGFIWKEGVCDNRDMSPIFEKAISILALTLLEPDICGCVNFKRQVEHWKTDLAQSSSETSFFLSIEQSNSIFGTTRGGLHVQKLLNSSGLVAGMQAYA